MPPGRVPMLLLATLALVQGLPAAAAQSDDFWFYEGGEPGVFVRIEDASVADASAPGDAIVIDPAKPLRLSISIAPPPGETWNVRSVSVGMLVRGPGTPPPDALVQRSDTNATLPPGFTVVVNRTVDLGPVAKLGAGTFLMQTEIRNEHDERLFVQTFYVRVPVTAASILTVQGATVTAITAATGYGLWSIAKDVKELRDAWARHRRRQEMAKLDVIGKTEHALEEVVAKGGKPLAGIVSLHRAAGERERGLGPVRWAATGLGLGGVAMAWLQFLGYLALDATSLLVTAAEACAAFLTIALVTNALLKRRASPKARPEPEPIVRVPVQEGSRAPDDVDASEAVQPADKRG